MTSYPGSIDMTEPGQGVKFSAIVGSGGVTAGYPVMWDSANNTVVASTGTTDIIVGLARDTVASAGKVTVLGPGCLVLTPFTLTVGGKVTASGGALIDAGSGTIVGTVDTAGTLASQVRVQIQY
jgi:phage baseplate assembly protein gpV